MQASCNRTFHVDDLSTNRNVDQASNVNESGCKCRSIWSAKVHGWICETNPIAAIMTRSVINLHGNCAAIIPNRGREMNFDHPIIASQDNPLMMKSTIVVELFHENVRLPACWSATANMTDPPVKRNKPKKSNCCIRIDPSLSHFLFRDHTNGRTIAGIAQIGALRD